jgi:hypothetical protein
MASLGLRQYKIGGKLFAVEPYARNIYVNEEDRKAGVVSDIQILGSFYYIDNQPVNEATYQYEYKLAIARNTRDAQTQDN